MKKFVHFSPCIKCFDFLAILSFLLPGQIFGQFNLTQLFADAPLQPRTMLEVAEGELLIAGTIEISPSATQVLLVSCTIQGEVHWARTLSANGFETIRGMIATSDGGYAIIGMTTGGGLGQEDLLLMKLNGAGDLLWSKVYGGAQEDRGFDLYETPDHHLLLAGSTRSFGAGMRDAFLIKTDLDGNMIWSRTYGEFQNDNFFEIQPVNNSEYVLSGVSLSFSNETHDYLLTKLDEDGNLIWSKAYFTPDHDHGILFTKTSDDGFIIYGHSAFFNIGDFAGMIVKTDHAGVMQWAKAFGGPGTTRALNIFTDDSQNLFLSGQITGVHGPGNDMFLLQMDEAGNMKKGHTFGLMEEETQLWGTQSPILDIGNDHLVMNWEQADGNNSGISLISFPKDEINSCFGQLWSPQLRDASISSAVADLRLGNLPAAARAITFTTTDLPLEENLVCQVPRADFVLPDNICLGECIDFQDLSTGMPDTWLWTFSNAGLESSNEQNPQNVCFDVEGLQAVQLIVSNEFGADTLQQTIVVVTDGATCPVAPVAGFSIPGTVCAGDCIDLLDVSTGVPDTWNWKFEGADVSGSEEMSPQDICYSSPGTYSVLLIVSNTLGEDSLEQSITVLPVPEVELGADLELCRNDSLLLSPETSGAEGFHWADDPQLMEAERWIRQPGKYLLEVFAGACTASDSIQINEIFCENCSVYLPNAFSPNQDGINDTFFPHLSCEPASYALRIFDRWGRLVFQSSAPGLSGGWDGTSRGQACAQGMYIFTLEIQFLEVETSSKQLYSGEINLLR
jgi:gliding motility-associated-like protein